MNRRSFIGSAIAAMSIAGAFARPPKLTVGDVPITTFGKTGVKVGVIAQGGTRVDLLPDVQAAAEHVRRVYELGMN